MDCKICFIATTAISQKAYRSRGSHCNSMREIRVWQKKVSPSKNPKNLPFDFEWSFKPFLLWMQLIGIDLYPSPQTRSDIHKYLLKFYNLLLLIVHLVIAGLYGTIEFELNEQLSSGFNVVSFYLNNAVNTVNAIACYVVSHVLLMIMSGDSWTGIWQTLQQIEGQYPLANRHFKKFRNIFLGGLGFIFLVGFPTICLELCDTVSRLLDCLFSSLFRNLLRPLGANICSGGGEMLIFISVIGHSDPYYLNVISYFVLTAKALSFCSIALVWSPRSSLN